jgi:adenosylcobyric acid synthase
MQMLGREIADPEGIERQGRIPGLGLLNISTSMQTVKVTRLSSGTIHHASLFQQQLQQRQIAGYEIHVGKTSYLDQAEPFATLENGELDGCISTDRRVLGTYLHGIFDDDSFRHQFLYAASSYHHLSSPSVLNPWRAQREESLDRLSSQVSTSLDMRQIFSWAGLEYV